MRESCRLFFRPDLRARELSEFSTYKKTPF